MNILTQSVFTLNSNNNNNNNISIGNNTNISIGNNTNANNRNLICKKVCLFTNARDEKHIKEWAAHHLLIGFDKIIIFDHKSKIPLIKVFNKFDKRVKIINVSYVNNCVKTTLMNKARDIANFLKMDWMIYLDADEFIILNNKYKGIKHFLSVYNHADSLGINWLFFGSNYLKKDPNGLMLENYTRSELRLNDHMKSFVRPSQIINAGNPHYYVIKNKKNYYGINNVNIKDTYHSNDYAIEYYNSPIYIAHYFYQSEETFANRKLLLPRDDTGTFREKHDLSEIHKHFNSVENNQPKNMYAERVKKFLITYDHEY
jgi:hypothetical protein